MIALNINSAGFAAQMRRLTNRVRQSRAIVLAAGQAVADELRRRCRQNDREEPDQPDGSRDRFWLAVMHSVQGPVASGSGATVAVTITAPRLANLVGTRSTASLEGRSGRSGTRWNASLPESPRRSAADHDAVPTLFLIRPRRHSRRAATQRPVPAPVEYLFPLRADQALNPAVFPSEETLEQVALDAARKAAEQQLTGNSNL